MNENNSKVTILMAEDDADDFFLARDAMEETGFPADLRLVSDGLELMDYLLQKGKFANGRKAPRPGIILLDLNMPKMDGRQVLTSLRTNPVFRSIPIVVFTTSGEAEDIDYCYANGASSYIRKPATFERLVEVMGSIGRYWFDITALPNRVDENSTQGHCPEFPKGLTGATD